MEIKNDLCGECNHPRQYHIVNCGRCGCMGCSCKIFLEPEKEKENEG